jgi:hypothetical protein
MAFRIAQRFLLFSLSFSIIASELYMQVYFNCALLLFSLDGDRHGGEKLYPVKGASG